VICCLTGVYRRIEGSPNFRRVPLTLRLVSSGSSSPSDIVEFVTEDAGDGRMVSGRFADVLASSTIFLNWPILLAAECRLSKG
jgi:hypothetical protein